MVPQEKQSPFEGFDRFDRDDGPRGLLSAAVAQLLITNNLRYLLNFLTYESRSLLRNNVQYKFVRSSEEPHSSFSLGRIS